MESIFTILILLFFSISEFPNFSDVSEVTFKLYSTKFYQPDQNIYENIKFDETTKTASLKQGSMYDDSLNTLVVAHGNGGGYPLDKDLWAHYSQVYSYQYNI